MALSQMPGAEQADALWPLRKSANMEDRFEMLEIFGIRMAGASPSLTSARVLAATIHLRLRPSSSKQGDGTTHDAACVCNWRCLPPDCKP